MSFENLFRRRNYTHKQSQKVMIGNKKRQVSKSFIHSMASKKLKNAQHIHAAFKTIKVELRRVLQICYIALRILLKSGDIFYQKVFDHNENKSIFHVEEVFMLWEEILGVKSLVRLNNGGDIHQDPKDGNRKNVPTTEKWKYIISNMEREVLVEEAGLHRKRKSEGNSFHPSDSSEDFIYDFIQDKLVQLGLLSVVKRITTNNDVKSNDITKRAVSMPIINSNNYDDQKLVWFKGYGKLNHWFLQNTYLSPDDIYQTNRRVKYFQVNRELCAAYVQKTLCLRFKKWSEKLDSIMAIALCKKVAVMESFFYFNPKSKICLTCSAHVEKWFAHDYSKMYALKMLPSHLLRNQDLDHFVELITSPVFVLMRLSVLKIQKAVKHFIFDFQSFNHCLQRDSTNVSTAYDNAIHDACQLITKCIEHYAKKTTYSEIAFALRSIGNSLIKMDKGSDAFDFFAQGLKYAKKAEGLDSNLVSDLLQIVANDYLSKGQYVEGAQCYEEVILLEKSQLNKDTIVIARILDKLGLIYWVLKKTDKAIEVIEESLLLNKLKFGYKTMKAARMLHKLAILLSFKKNYERAVQYNTEAELIAQKTCGKENVDKIFLIKVYASLGKLYLKKRDNENALRCFNKLLNIAGDDVTIDFAQIYDIMGSVYCLKEMYPEAISCFHKGLDHLKTSKSSKTGKIIRINRCLAYALQRNRQYEEAVLKYKEIIPFFKNEGSLTAEDISGILCELGSCYKNMNFLVQAEKVLDESLDVQRNLLSNDDAVRQVVSGAFHNLGGVLATSKYYERALKCFFKALDIRRAMFGEKHLDTVNTLNSIGVVYFNLNDDDAAMFYFRKALNHRISLLGCHHEKVADTLQNMACVHKECLELDLATINYERAHKIRVKRFGNSNEIVAISLYDVAVVKALSCDFKNSLHEFERILNMYRELGYSNDVPQVKNILHWITFLRQKLVDKIICDYNL